MTLNAILVSPAATLSFSCNIPPKQQLQVRIPSYLFRNYLNKLKICLLCLFQNPPFTLVYSLIHNSCKSLICCIRFFICVYTYASQIYLSSCKTLKTTIAECKRNRNDMLTSINKSLLCLNLNFVNPEKCLLVQNCSSIMDDSPAKEGCMCLCLVLLHYTDTDFRIQKAENDFFIIFGMCLSFIIFYTDQFDW